MIKDIFYASLFRKEDVSTLYRLAEKVRSTHNQELVDDFNLKCQKKWDDHNPILEIGNQRVEFLQSSKADDLVVTAGINQSIDQILGTSLIYWQLMTCGTGTNAPAAGNVALQSGIGFTVDCLAFGWRENASSSLRFATIWGETLGTITINEAAVVTATGGVILNRDVFSNHPITHTVNDTVFVLSSVVEFVPVM